MDRVGEVALMMRFFDGVLGGRLSILDLGRRFKVVVGWLFGFYFYGGSSEGRGIRR